MLADPLLSLGKILGSFKLTLKPLSTLKMTSNLFTLQGVQVHLSGAKTTRTAVRKKNKKTSRFQYLSVLLTTWTSHRFSALVETSFWLLCSSLWVYTHVFEYMENIAISKHLSFLLCKSRLGLRLNAVLAHVAKYFTLNLKEQTCIVQ